MHCSWKQKNILFYSSPPVKKLLNLLSHSVPLSLSLSLSLILSQNSLNLSSSHPLLVTLLSPSIASPYQAADRLTIPSHRSLIASSSLSSLPTQLADDVLVCDWWLLILFGLGWGKKLEIWVFFFFPAVDWWWWWWWCWCWGWLWL